MFRKGLGMLVLMLAGCSAAGPEEGDPTGQARTFTPWPGPGSLDESVVALLPAGVGAADVLLGSDGCYYYSQAGAVRPVRWDDDPTHYKCIM